MTGENQGQANTEQAPLAEPVNEVAAVELKSLTCMVSCYNCGYCNRVTLSAGSEPEKITITVEPTDV